MSDAHRQPVAFHTETVIFTDTVLGKIVTSPRAGSVMRVSVCSIISSKLTSKAEYWIWCFTVYYRPWQASLVEVCVALLAQQLA